MIICLAQAVEESSPAIPWLIPLLSAIGLLAATVLVLLSRARRSEDLSHLPKALEMEPVTFDDTKARDAALYSIFGGSVLFMSEYMVDADAWLWRQEKLGAVYVVRVSGYPVPGHRRVEEALGVLGRRGYAETTETFVAIEPALPPGVTIPRFLLVPNNFIIQATDSKRRTVKWPDGAFTRRNRVTSRQPELVHRAFGPRAQQVLSRNRSLSIEGLDDRVLVFSRYGRNLSTQSTVELVAEARTITAEIVAGLSRHYRPGVSEVPILEPATP